VREAFARLMEHVRELAGNMRYNAEVRAAYFGKNRGE
jgi:hypothetical protein